MIAFIFPGQGSQKVGMGMAIAETFPEARAVFDEADAVLPDLAGGPLSRIIGEGPAERLMLTEHTQPAILTASVAASRVLEARGWHPTFLAGHSLGEYSAHCVAGTLAFGDAVRIVHRRGRYMQAAVPTGHGAMAAILGLDEVAVRQACEEGAEGDVVSPANINGAGQIVIAGTAAAVQRTSVRAKALGARRTVSLPVSAPFHCALMKPAEERLAPDLRALAVARPKIPVVANVDAEIKREAEEAIEALVRQVSAPVRWAEVVQRLASEGVTTYVEVGPGSVLSSLVRKIHPEATVVNFAEPDDLAAVEDALLA